MTDYKKIFNFLKLDNIIDHVSDLIEAKVSIYKVEMKFEVAKIGSRLLTFIILSFILFMVLLFLSFTGATLLNEVLNSRFWGYAIITGFYLLIFILFIVLDVSEMFRKKFESFLLDEADIISKDGDSTTKETEDVE